MLKSKKGFTLVEVIIVVTIMSILSAITVPYLVGYINKGKIRICETNRSIIMRAYKSLQISDNDVTLEKVLNGEYNVLPGDVNNKSCPRGGIYTVSEDGNSIICSICSNDFGHSPEDSDETEEPETPEEPEGLTYPGTNILLTPSLWPSQDDFQYSWSSYNFTEGQVFQHADGKYYVITEDFSITKSQAQNGPDSIKQWSGITQFSGKMMSSLNVSGTRINKADNGDIYRTDDGDYYIYTSYNGVDAEVPPYSYSYWYKLPKKE